MTKDLLILVLILIMLLIIIFFAFSSIKSKREEKKANEQIKKAYSQNNKYTEAKKENEKKINDMESARGADSVSNAFDLLYNVSKKGQERNGK